VPIYSASYHYNLRMNETEFQDIPTSLSNRFLEYAISRSSKKGSELVVLYEEYNKDLKNGKTIRIDYQDDYILIKYSHPIYQVNYFTDGNNNAFKKHNQFIKGLHEYVKRIYIFEDTIISTKVVDDVILFDLQQIENLLSYKKNSIEKYYGKMYGIILSEHKGKKYIDINDLQLVLNKSRKPKAKMLLEQLDLDTKNKSECVEAGILSHIGDYLDQIDVKYELQYRVGKYYIDMYLPQRKIAIEVDEIGHRNRSAKAEIKRENYIRDQLSCKFVRIDPTTNNFRITKAIGQVGLAIMSEH
jgi:very-short-patch-repair endonuclease